MPWGDPRERALDELVRARGDESTLHDRSHEHIRTVAHERFDHVRARHHAHDLSCVEHDCAVSEVMTPEPFIVEAGADLKQVVETMATRKLGSAIVVEGSKVFGIFTTTDALHLLLRHLAIDDLRGL